MPAPSLAELIKDLTESPSVEKLREALQTAIQLEFSTIPPYLTAFWSVKTGGPVKTALKTIWKEEMLHMGLVCNMLRAVGGQPQLDSPSVVPTYPTPLPGGVHPHLTVALEGFGNSALRTFLQIEYPRTPPVAHTEAERAEAAVLGGLVLAAQGAATIGEFYEAILAAFHALAPTLAITADGQVESDSFNPPLTKVTTLAEVEAAIELISKQGEGSSESPDDTGPSDLAHYYRFGEMREGKKLVKDATTGVYGYTGAAVAVPSGAAVWPVGPIPIGGFKPEVVDDSVAPTLAEFDDTYRKMLALLQAAWGPGTQAERDQALSDSIDVMKELTPLAKALMEKPLKDGSGKHSGPNFRVV